MNVFISDLSPEDWFRVTVPFFIATKYDEPRVYLAHNTLCKIISGTQGYGVKLYVFSSTERRRVAVYRSFNREVKWVDPCKTCKDASRSDSGIDCNCV